MAKGRARLEWRQTASLMAHLVNIHPHRKPGAAPVTADTFDPFAEPRRTEVGIEALSFLAQVEPVKPGPR